VTGRTIYMEESFVASGRKIKLTSVTQGIYFLSIIEDGIVSETVSLIKE
jgi:hypothetical protein